MAFLDATIIGSCSGAYPGSSVAMLPRVQNPDDAMNRPVYERLVYVLHGVTKTRDIAIHMCRLGRLA